MSSPSLSNLTIVGCLLLQASVFTTALDATQISDWSFIVKCHLERIFISLGVSFAFGSTLMKTYRIHAIFTLAVKRFKQIDLPDWKLISGVFGLVLTDCVIFVTWIAVDVMTVHTVTLKPRLDMTEPEKEIFDVPEIRYCASTHEVYFIAALYITKGIVLTFGLFLAWETRNIAVSRLSDSKSIAASVYIVALSIALTIPTIASVNDDANITVLVAGVVIVTVSTSVLCLNFVPKVYVLLTMQDRDITLSMMQSMGYGKPTEPTAANTSHLSSGTETTGHTVRLRLKLDQKQGELNQLLSEVRLKFCERTGDATSFEGAFYDVTNHVEQ
ncbi:gamma-aminobutyric acid type B receptor subunit 2-like [Acanthaster planci]|uniref:Gamma-aminobutyric acid type B receptor subunit 2-like n=1 Tax=Acanthaster planci TaxID=133434 RepID=A0A8B7Y625_ACAPL|nr:gamma-aminobutyric acid type B receptor subunit 2-like [Acanthaster planci]